MTKLLSDPRRGPWVPCFRLRKHVFGARWSRGMLPQTEARRHWGGFWKQATGQFQLNGGDPKPYFLFPRRSSVAIAPKPSRARVAGSGE